MALEEIEPLPDGLEKIVGVSVEDIMVPVRKYSPQKYTIYPGPELEKNYIRTHTITMNHKHLGKILNYLRRKHNLDEAQVHIAGPKFYPFLTFMASYNVQKGYRRLYKSKLAYLQFDGMIPELTILRSREQVKLKESLEQYREKLRQQGKVVEED